MSTEKTRIETLAAAHGLLLLGAHGDEREAASPGPWPTEAEYELWQNDEFTAGASGSPEDAARQIMHYAAVYGQDGPVKIYEVKRYEVSPDALATAIRARGER